MWWKVLTVIVLNGVAISEGTPRGSQLPVYNNLTITEGSAVLLPCHVTEHTGVVTWWRPNDNQLISQDYHVFNPSKADNIRIINDPDNGEYSLQLMYVVYPRDHGMWVCGNTGRGHQITTLTVLVPPADPLPVVTPTHFTEVDVTTESLAFTCSAHFAYPPVHLEWVKVIGIDLPFEVTPPSLFMSAKKLGATSVKLVLTPLHIGSEFVCRASHPAFMGKVFTRSLHYQKPPELQARALVQSEETGPRHLQADARKKGKLSSFLLSWFDHVMLIVLSVLITLAFLIIIALVKTRKRWELNVKFIPKYIRNTAHASSNGCSPGSCSPLKSEEDTLQMQIFGTDSMTSVLAGSALWIDCSRLVFPLTSLIHVKWLKNTEVFYRQYFINGQNVGSPPNSTIGYNLGMRVTSLRSGQINVWPILPAETDAFTCEVTLMKDNSGQTETRRHTTAVFVTMGPVKNWILIGLIGTALMALVAAIILMFVHTIRCIPKRSTRKPVENGLT